MKIKLLLSVITVGATIAAVGGMADVWAACVPTKDCATLGYKYTAAQCNGKGVACPFDTTLWSCVPPAPKEGRCCGYSGEVSNTACRYNGTSHNNDSSCQRYFGQSCYNECMNSWGVTCDDMQASCQASGGTPIYQSCSYYGGYDGNNYTWVELKCEMPKPAPKEGRCCGYRCFPDEHWCQKIYSKNCYKACREDYGLPDCNDMHASCRASEGVPRFEYCFSYPPFNYLSIASFECR